MVPLITRVDSVGNPGDIFIRYGLQWLMNRWAQKPLSYLLIDKFNNKHFEQYQKELRQTKTIIYAGTPQFNNYDDWIFWYDWDMWKQYIIPLELEFHTIAGGAGYPDLKMSAKAFADRCMDSAKTKKILKTRFQHTKTCTVRDTHALELASRFMPEAELLPCTATWAYRWIGMPAATRETCIVACSPSAVLPELVKQSSTEGVANYLRRSFRELKTKLNADIICHGQKEYELLKDLGAIYTNDPLSLLRLCGSYKNMVSARLHGAVPFADLPGRRSVLIAVDTRSNAARELGIPVIPVSDITPERVSAALEPTQDHELVISQAEAKYMALFDRAFGSLRL